MFPRWNTALRVNFDQFHKDLTKSVARIVVEFIVGSIRTLGDGAPGAAQVPISRVRQRFVRLTGVIQPSLGSPG